MATVEQVQQGTRNDYVSDHERERAVVARMDAVLSGQNAQEQEAGIEGPDYHRHERARGPDGKFVKQDAEENAEGNAGEEELDGEDTPQEPPKETPQEKRKYKVPKQEDDDPDEVDEDELVQGYMRQRDYTRKRQKESQETKAARAKYAADVAAERNNLAQAVNFAKASLVKALAPDLMDVRLDELWGTDPAKAGQVQARLNRVHVTLQQVDQLVAAVNQKAQAEQQAQYDEAVKSAVEDLNTLPDWSDDKYSEVLRFGVKQYGFTQEEMANVIDARAIRMALDAQAYHALKAEKVKAEKVPAKPATELMPVKPGGPRTSQVAKEYRDKRQAVSAHKTLEAGAGYFKEMFRMEKR